MGNALTAQPRRTGRTIHASQYNEINGSNNLVAQNYHVSHSHVQSSNFQTQPSNTRSVPAHPLRLHDIMQNEAQQWNQLATVLDSNWRQLGELLGEEPAFLARLEKTYNQDPHFSPSKVLLQKWQHQGSANIENFMEILHKLDNFTAQNIMHELSMKYRF